MNENNPNEQIRQPNIITIKPKNQKSSKALVIMLSSLILVIIIAIIFILVLGKSSKKLSEDQLINGADIVLGENQNAKFILNDKENEIRVESIVEDSADIKIGDNQITINIGQEKKLDLNGDGIYDLSIKIEEVVNRKAKFTIKKIEEAILPVNITDNNQPATNNVPAESPSCTENWSCDSWLECSNNLRTRYCRDSNNCGTEANKPSTLKSCFENCTSHYEYKCYNNDVYWYNSCGDREDTKVGCSGSLKCENGECAIKNCTESGYSICSDYSECLGEAYSSDELSYPQICCKSSCGSTLTCSEAGYTLCEEASRCSGKHYNSSDATSSQVCCKGTCDTRPTCSKAGGYFCPVSSRKCNATTINASDASIDQTCCPMEAACPPKNCEEKNKNYCEEGEFCRVYNSVETIEDKDAGQLCCSNSCEPLPVCGNEICEYGEGKSATTLTNVECFINGTPSFGLLDFLNGGCDIQGCPTDCQ